MATKQVLVSYQERKKVLHLPANESEGALDHLTKEFQREFKIPSTEFITFQYYDASWEEYIDMDNQKEIQHKDKLKVIVSKV